MHLDNYGLPTQADGDANDQLHRCGLIVTAIRQYERVPEGWHETYGKCAGALRATLQPQKGIFRRHASGPTDDVSADQLISALAGLISLQDAHSIGWLALRTALRGGFAQNTRKIHDPDRTWKVPDFFALRALPLFLRAHWTLRPLALLTDIILIPTVLFANYVTHRGDKDWFVRKGPDDTDDNNLILTLTICQNYGKTPFSEVASRIYAKTRPENFGSDGTNPIHGALKWYHRAESGGNPEIADLWKPLINTIFYNQGETK